MRDLSRSALALLASLTGCQSSGPAPERIALASASYDPSPQTPLILRDVALVDDAAAWTQPYVPGHRTSMDGRVALRVQGGTRDVPPLDTMLSFFLFAPEKLSEPIVTGPPGAAILADAEPFMVEFPPALDPEVFRLGHHALCDPTEEFAVSGERTNPYPCGEDGLNDCYDLTVISSTSPALSAQMWGTPVTVEVAQPKTAAAQLVDVTLGEPVMGIEIPSSTEFTEPAVTVDGRLLTGRLGRVLRSWTHPDSGEVFTRPYDLAYALLPDDAEPCDVTGWTDLHPISHAPYDARMVERYGLAAYPFRDTEGQPIPDGEDMGGTYPWVDREGANLFMTGVHGRLSEQSETDYPRRCVHEGCDVAENTDFDRGYLVAGLWTRGKLVHLDGMINHLYWSVGVTPQAHYSVDLFEDDQGLPVPVRVGGGRFVNAFRAEGPYPPGYTHNANVLDSLQNLPNFWPDAKPITPRDVVWVMSNGVATTEVVFDDLLDANAILLSNMQPSVTQLWGDAGESLGIPRVHNGQVRELGGGPGVLATYTLAPDEQEDLRIQNGATTLRWAVPAVGVVPAGQARTEPAALGGVHGRGLWLSGAAGVTYAMPTQPELDAEDAFVGIWVDDRATDGGARELLRFPDNSGVLLQGDDVLYVAGDEVVHRVPLPRTGGWMHLGWRLRQSHRDLTLLVDGLALDRLVASGPLFRFSGGDLVLGRATGAWTGARGWVDDLKILAHDVDPEVACNHARGTLVAVEPGSELAELAGRYPVWAHEAAATAAGATDLRVACWMDPTRDHGVDLRDLPDGATPLRDAILFPEGPLRAGTPRPDSSDNPFCLTCHTDDSAAGLHTDALALDPSTLAEHDRRRQPSQPPRRVFGNIPAGWIPADAGPGSPDEALQAPPEGLLIDPWVLPGG